MFFRIKHSPSGQVLQLLESYRNPQNQPRQRVVISLGDAALAQPDWKPVAAAVAAQLLRINRLVEPLSEHALREWLPGTALPELFGEEILKGDPNRFYYVSDALLRKQAPLEAHLRAAQARQFRYPRTILLYDLTNTHFEGQALGNPKAKRGKNKQGRSDCPQVVVGMVYDEQGFELRSFAAETFLDSIRFCWFNSSVSATVCSRERKQLDSVSVCLELRLLRPCLRVPL
jgi:hypothetical protein